MSYFYRRFLEYRAIGLRCNHCHKLIASNTPWVCGFCQAKNQDVDDFPFVNSCEHCGAEPKAYQCHHCKQLIFLNEDQLTVNYARCVFTPVTDEATDGANLRDREKQAMEHQLLMARLTSELNAENHKAEFAKKKTPVEKVEEDFTKHHAAHMAAHDIARREKAVNEEKYKDDPYLLERANESVDTWLKDQL